MPAFDSSNCGQGRNTICSAFYQAAIRASGGQDVADVLKFIADQFAADIEEHKVGHTVWANDDDEYPGTLSQKLAAGTNITLTEGAPSGTVGRAANERVITIAASGGATDTKIGNVNDGATNVAPCDKITFSSSGDATVSVSDDGSDDATVTIGVDVGSTIGSSKGGGWDLTAVIKIHFKGDQTVTGTTVDSNDWRDRFVDVWGWPADVDDEFNTDAELQQNDNKDGGPLATLQLMYTIVHTSSDEDTYLISNSYAHAAGTIYISANDNATGDFVEAELYVDVSDSGKLKMDFTHSDPGDQECEGFFMVVVRASAKTSTVTKTTVGNGH
jgi:hypothetical protein